MTDSPEKHLVYCLIERGSEHDEFASLTRAGASALELSTRVRETLGQDRIR